MMGVAHDLFWNLTPKSLDPYVKAFTMQQEYDDRLAWQNGAYIRMAIGSLVDAKAKYPDKPLSDKSRVVKKVDNENRKMNEIKDKMIQRMSIVNSQFKK